MPIPTVALMCITDGRWDYLRQTVASAEAHLGWQFAHKVLVDDSGSATELAPRFDGWRYQKNAERLGLAGAIQAGWDCLPDCDYVFHLEDDFVFPQHVDLWKMLDPLREDPKLAQVALMRQPWSPEEQHLGSVYRTAPGAYREVDGLVRHRRLFTFNPCLYPRSICDYGAGLEAEVTATLLTHGYEFAYLGKLDDPPRCWHIGHVRSSGYRW